MGSILIGIFTFALVIVCILLVLVILMQRPNANSGMGAALGGGAVESIIGGETGNVLTRVTVKLTVLFFVLSACLYFGYVYLHSNEDDSQPQTLSISSVGQPTQQQKTAEKSGAAANTSTTKQAAKTDAQSAKTEAAAAPAAKTSATAAQEKPAAAK